MNKKLTIKRGIIILGMTSSIIAKAVSSETHSASLQDTASNNSLFSAVSQYTGVAKYWAYKVWLSLFEDIYKEWFSAAWHGDVAKIQELLDIPGIDIDKRTPRDNRTALIKAAISGKVDVCNLLLDNGADPMLTDTVECTALHWACQSGATDFVKRLIEKGVDINQTDGIGMTPLMIAAYHEKIDIANLLLDNGADVTLVDIFGETALHNACKKGNRDLVQRLIEQGADINKVNEDHETPLVIAINGGWDDICNLLLDYGAGSNIEASIIWSITQEALYYEDFFSIMERLLTLNGARATGNYFARNSFHLACSRGAMKIAKLLARHKVNINANTNKQVQANTGCNNGYELLEAWCTNNDKSEDFQDYWAEIECSAVDSPLKQREALRRGQKMPLRRT